MYSLRVFDERQQRVAARRIRRRIFQRVVLGRRVRLLERKCAFER
jgi:hypothetical protein